MLYFYVCIAYSYIILLDVSCTKDNKYNLLGVTKNIKVNKFRVLQVLNGLNKSTTLKIPNISWISNFFLYSLIA